MTFHDFSRLFDTCVKERKNSCFFKYEKKRKIRILEQFTVHRITKLVKNNTTSNCQ